MLRLDLVELTLARFGAVASIGGSLFRGGKRAAAFQRLLVIALKDHQEERC